MTEAEQVEDLSGDQNLLIRMDAVHVLHLTLDMFFPSITSSLPMQCSFRVLKMKAKCEQ